MAPQSSESQTSETVQSGRGGDIASSRRCGSLAAGRAAPSGPIRVCSLAAVLVALVVVAVFAPVFAPYPPLSYHPAIATQPPSPAHWLGTRCARARPAQPGDLWRAYLAVGGRGRHRARRPHRQRPGHRRWLPARLGNQVISMIVDALLAFPVADSGAGHRRRARSGITNGHHPRWRLCALPIYVRLARGQTLQIRSLDYVTASRAVGTPAWRILLRHIFPEYLQPAAGAGDALHLLRHPR